MKIFKITLFVFILYTTTAKAQLVTDTLNVDLQEVRIEALRFSETPQTATFAFSRVIIPEERRNSTPGLVLNEPLRAVPGIWINDRNNFSVGERLSVRGMGWRAAFGVRGVFMMLDGIPLTMPDGQAILSLVDPSMITSAELVRGPSSVFWGNGSGGALILSTQNNHLSSYARTRFSAGSFGLYKTDFDTGWVSGANRFQLIGSYTALDGYRKNSRFEAFRLGGNADLRFSDGSRLQITGAFLDSPVSDNPGSLTATEVSESPSMANSVNINQRAGKITRHGQVGVRYSQFFSYSDLTLQAYALARNLKNPLNFAWVELNRLGGGFRGTYIHRFNDFEVATGADLSLQSDDRKNWANVQGDKGSLMLSQQEQVVNTAGFARIKVPLGQLSFSAGLRYDLLYFSNTDRFFADNEDNSGDRTFSSFSPMAGLGYDLGVALAYLNFSTGFESPTTTELVNRPDMTGGFNPDLDPERSTSVELGIRGEIQEAALTYDVAVFRTWVNDIMIPFRTEEGGDRDFFRNFGSTEHTGFEVFMMYSPLQWLSLQSAYSWSYFIFADEGFDTASGSVKGNRIPGIPRSRISSIVRMNYNSLRFSIEQEYASSIFVNNQNSVRNEAYHLFNANVSVQQIHVGHGVRVTPYVQMNNLFDERYNGSVIINAFGGRFFEPAPGRNFVAGISVAI